MYAKYIRNFSSWEQAKQSVPMGGKHGGKGKASYGQRPQQRVTDWIEYDLLKDVVIRKFWCCYMEYGITQRLCLSLKLKKQKTTKRKKNSTAYSPDHPLVSTSSQDESL